MSLPSTAVPVPMLPAREIRVTEAAEIEAVAVVCSIEPTASIRTAPEVLTIPFLIRTRPAPVEVMLMLPVSEP
ncbi:unannotated protein [freshwater metagenome]|uniref:Unannotated protein n=1 Tax=freshwater metagenome TaxID=449393 RepID=A0A6J7JVA3_9ZZZZ